jgi:protein-serine/threonine kinase
MTPPFVPHVKDLEDTRYFDEEEPISDVSESQDNPEPTVQEIAEALRHFNREIQILATGFVVNIHDSVKLRKIEREIEAFNLSDEQKEYLKGFVKHFGRKEKKRPRDRLLRDRDCKDKVMELRKKGAFLGYTYRRIRKGGSVRMAPGASTRKTVWHRARLSMH